MRESTKKNIIYQVCYEILILILPFITSPYISRVIGVNGIGIYAYSYSVASYFMLFAMLGIRNYATRYIARIRANQEKLNSTFSELLSIHLFVSTIVFVVYIIYAVKFSKYPRISIINSIFVLSSVFDISWFFFGLEKFKTTVSSNVVIKCLTVILIFIFVKNSDDLDKYCFIMATGFFFTQIYLWFKANSIVKLVPIKFGDIMKHLKPQVVLFIPSIAVSIYKILDKIMLGYYGNMEELGYFENAEKISGVPITIIAAFGFVLMPRVSKLIEDKNNECVIHYITISMKYLLGISFLMGVLLCLSGRTFAICFWGNSFEKSGLLIELLAITIPIMTFANIIRTQFLIPNNMDAVFVGSVICGAVINVISNFFLIKLYGSIGTAVSTILAELTVCVYQSFYIRELLDIKKYTKLFTYFLAFSIFIFVASKSFFINCQHTWSMFITQILVGISIFSLPVIYMMHKGKDVFLIKLIDQFKQYKHIKY